MAKKRKPPARRPKPKPAPAPAPAASGPTLEPVAGTVTPVGSASGAPPAPPGGDLTGTSALNALFAQSVFGTGAGQVPQYNHQDTATAAAQAEAVTAQSQGAAG